MSIRTRITLFGLAVLGGVLMLCCLAVFALLASGVPNTQDQALRQRAEQAASALAGADPDGLPPARGRPDPAAVDPRTSTEIFVIVYDRDAAVLASGGGVDGRLPAVPRSVLDAAATGDGVRATVQAAPGVPVRVHARRWQGRSGGGVVVAAQSTGRVAADRGVVFALVAVYAILGFGVGVPAIWLVTGRALRPLRHLAGLADEVARSGDLSQRLPPVATRDDLGRLTTGFNAMMSRLQDAYHRQGAALAAQQRFTADASHELRTPLTSIRSNAGFLLHHPDAEPAERDAALRDIAAESERMGRLVDSLLTLARADAGLQLPRTPVDLSALAERVCRQATALHPDREISCSVTPTPPVPGDEDALAQLLWILLDNAVRFAGTGGHVWVAVTQRGQLAQLHVSDDGPGIPPGQHERIFDRFHRADNARSGSGAGLGLAIAGWIVRVHGGAITAANNARGGASFVAEMPTVAGVVTQPLGIGPAGVSSTS